MNRNTKSEGAATRKGQARLDEAKMWIWRCAAKESEALTQSDRDYWVGLRVMTEMIHGITFEQIKKERELDAASQPVDSTKPTPSMRKQK